MGLFVKLYAAIVRKRWENDPVMKKHIKAADDIGKKIQAHIDQRKKDDPELAATMDYMDKIVGR